MKYKNLTQILTNNLNKDINENSGIMYITNERKETFISYKDLYTKCRKILYGLNLYNVKAGDQLILQIVDVESYIYIIWACFMGNIVAIPLSVARNEEQNLRINEIKKSMDSCYIVTDIRPEDISSGILSFKSLDGIDNEGEIIETELDDIALIQYSSGSTGTPKGVILTHENLLTTIVDMIESAQVISEDLVLSWMPITHDFGLIAFHLLPLYLGINQYQMSTELFLKAPVTWFEYLDRFRISITASPNFGLRHMEKYCDVSQITNIDLSCIRLICNGAEPISYNTCLKFTNKFEKFNLKSDTIYPVYGLAEAGLAVTMPKAFNGALAVNVLRKNLSIGQAVHIVDYEDECETLQLVKVGCHTNRCQLRICDDSNIELADKFIGHIQIKGRNVTSGYYKNNELTKQLFTDDCWLKTGDLGFMYEDELVITGRVKDVIFVNGQNYYAYDIERCIQLNNKYAISDVAVVSVQNKDISEEVVAFIKYDENINDFVKEAQFIKEYCMQQIGVNLHYVLPISEIPKTVSGKIMHYQLQEMFSKGEFNQLIEWQDNLILEEIASTIEYKDNTLENRIEELWKNILEKATFEKNSSFIVNGGDSIKSAILCNKLKKEFDISITVKDIFMGMTFNEICQLASEKNNQVEKNNLITSKIEHSPICEYYPLSLEQKRIFTAAYISQNKLYNINAAIKINGKYNKVKLEEAFKIIIDNHEIMRTSFHLIDGIPYQKVHNVVDFHIKEINYSDNLENDINACIDIFDLQEDSLFKVTAILINDRETILVINMHHIISDGTSIGNIISEMNEYFSKTSIEKPQYQYRDYVNWQNSWEKELKKEEMYWTREYQDIPEPLQMPLDFKRTNKRTYEGKKLEFNLSKDLTEKLKGNAKERDSSLFMVLFSIYSILLQKYSNQEDIVIGTTMSGRDEYSFEKNIGMFVNLLPIRTAPITSKTFNEFLDEIKEKTLATYSNQRYQFNMLVNRLKLENHNGRNPLFDTVFQLRNFYLPDLLSNEVKFEEVCFDNQLSMFDFKLEAVDGNEQICFILEYSTELFRYATMKQFAGNYINLAEQIVNNNCLRIEDVKIDTGERLHLGTELETEDVIYFSFD